MTSQTVPQLSKDEFGLAYAAGYERTVRFLLSRGAPREHAKDVAQAAWLRGWERLDQLRDATRLVIWINTIALNLFRRVARDESRLSTLLDMPSPNQLNWAAIDLSRILDSCRPTDRGLLQHQLVGRTAEEIARHEGTSQTAIRLRFLRARRAARCIAEKTSSHPSSRSGLACTAA